MIKKNNLFLLLALLLFSLSCRNNELKTINAFDMIKSLTAFFVNINPAFDNRTISLNSDARISVFSDRLLINISSWSSVSPLIYESTDGTAFKAYSVKLGDCIGGSTNKGGASCNPAYLGYENGTYSVFGIKTVFSPGSLSSTSAYYYGTGTSLSSISVKTVSSGVSISSQNPFFYSSGKLHIKQSYTLYSTADGVNWSTLTGTYCSTLYKADNGLPACSLAKSYDGTNWNSAGTITGGGGSINSFSYAVYMDNIYRVWYNNSGTLSIFKSTSGTLTGGLTFPAVADSTVNMNGAKETPSVLVKNTYNVYLMINTYFGGSDYTSLFLRSANGTIWNTVSPTFPSDLGTFYRVESYASFGSKFFLIALFKAGYFLLSSTDGINWTKINL